MRILVAGLGVPFPPLGGGLTRTFHLLRALAAKHQVVLAAFAYGETPEPPPYPVELHAVPWQWSSDYEAMTGADAAAAALAYRRLTFESDEPWFSSVMEPSAMGAAISAAFSSPVDLVLLEGTPMARFLAAVPPGIPRVLDLFDIHSAMAQRAARRSHGSDAALERELERTLVFERHAVQACDACLAVSDHDAATARDLLGASIVQLVPNGVDTSFFAPSTLACEPGMLLFTGRMSYGPNVDAVQHFASDILPRIRREVPAAVLHVVGAAPAPEVIALQGDDIVIHGRVDDVRPFQQRADVVVAPIRAGGGTRLKVLEAAASGKAIVTTALGAEGLPFRDGVEVLIAETSAEFAAAVVALLRDPERRQQLGASARAAARRFDWASIGATCRTFLERLVRGYA